MKWLTSNLLTIDTSDAVTGVYVGDFIMNHSKPMQPIFMIILIKRKEKK